MITGARMAFYYQHVGEELARRDIPRSIGTVDGGPLRLSVKEMRNRFGIDQFCPDADMMKLEAAGESYQIWGFPAGAEQTVKDIGPDDYLMLMGSRLFDVISRVAYRVPRFAHASSKQIWGEDRFPIIVLLKQSSFIALPFEVFSNKLGFQPNFHMRGNTMKVAQARISSSNLSSAEGLANWCKATGVI